MNLKNTKDIQEIYWLNSSLTYYFIIFMCNFFIGIKETSFEFKKLLEFFVIVEDLNILQKVVNNIQ